jgi:hypothetical protein
MWFDNRRISASLRVTSIAKPRYLFNHAAILNGLTALGIPQTVAVN